MKDKHFTSRLLTWAGALLTVSAVLMALCVKVAYGGILLAAASCMFFAARSFRIGEDKREREDWQESGDLKQKEGASDDGSDI